MIESRWERFINIVDINKSTFIRVDVVVIYRHFVDICRITSQQHPPVRSEYSTILSQCSEHNILLTIEREALIEIGCPSLTDRLVGLESSEVDACRSIRREEYPWLGIRFVFI